MTGQYYLDTNGKLIHKSFPIEDDSPFVIKIWDDAIIGKTQYSFLNFLIDAYRAGAKKEEINRLANRNNLNKFIPGWRNYIYTD